ncbi:bifunctional 3'-5' exonuclease/DNA polymerase [Kribbella sindirgiensis]|uniref:DNA-directed DNA polymerase n=1 Tax=Kribbella sindirgiensis TaxID=1124744 RepID=A0A4R0I9M9_9ACTN|nr:bifunctional 3'-5' exonuclease/DNA polymerase [Kribbella sindirgiensis]TCC28440.1 bifunctional 3'-5' exonuclease/DNA polymerase [Kribbella sindirgiensis]
MDERWLIAPEEGGGAMLVALHPDGQPAGEILREPDLVAAVASRPQVARWVWRSSTEIYPRLLAAGVRVERCYDIENTEGLLLGHEGRLGEPRSAAAAWARLSGRPVPPDPPLRAVVPGEQSSLFEIAVEPVPFDALLRVYADQLRRHDLAEYPDRMRLLTASESSAMLVAAEMDLAGLPWSADAHREVLSELLGERFAGSGEPRRLTELADQISAAFGHRVRPELPADVLKAFKQAGHQVKSTRKWELEHLDHPAVAPLLEYKKLYRIYTANGWSWLNDWVHDGRFRPGFLPGGTVSGRWITNGGGGLQIPKVIRRAVVADPGWRLVVADASQLEPRVLAAISRDRALMEVASDPGDLYKAVSDQAFSGDRAQAKLAVLGAIYGQTSGDGLKHLAMLRKRFPQAVAYVDDAARAGEEGRLVRTYLGRTCPPSGHPLDEAMLEGPPADLPATDPRHARARGRFTRNFVVQGSAADWALLLLAALRQSLAPLKAELVFHQHDEVIVHCPAEEAEQVTEYIQQAGNLAGVLTFGPTPANFAFVSTVVERYSDAK